MKLYIAITLAVALTTRPACAVPVLPPVRGVLAGDAAAAADSGVATADRQLDPDRPVDPRSPLDAPRNRIVHALIELDYEPARAREMAACLTAEDVAVLDANPRMIQAGGTLSKTGRAYLIGGLIVAGIVILAANSNSFFFVR